MSDPFNPTYCRRCHKPGEEFNAGGYCPACAEARELEEQVNRANQRAAEMEQQARAVASQAEQVYRNAQRQAQPVAPVATSKIAQGVFWGIAGCVIIPTLLMFLLAALGAAVGAAYWSTAPPR